MVAIQVEIRSGVAAKITADLSGYVLTSADIEETYYPKENIEALVTEPKIKVCCKAPLTDRDRGLRNTVKLLQTVTVQVAIQQKVDPVATAVIDTLVEFSEQIMASCEDDGLGSTKKYTWVQTAPERDPEGRVYSYEQLTTQGVFQVIFDLQYTHIKQA